MSGILGFVQGTTTEHSVIPIRSYRPISQDNDHILVVIDTQLYPWIKEKFTRYLNEVTERFAVEFSQVTVNGLQSRNPISPAELRKIIQKEYTINHTVGALLVGQIPYALWEQGVGNNSGQLSVFYEDLDGAFEDRNGDGFYDYHIFGPHEGPEIWVCWMRPPIFGQIFFMHRFLEKTHRYYVGETIIAKKAFIACHEDYDN